MTSPSPFGAFVPGFEFLQDLMKNAGATLPTAGQWVAPTLDPTELEKRINELRTVQFWLEQNARLIGTTIQTLEVQRMTLSTLKTMNVSMQDLGEAMTLKPAATEDAPAATPLPGVVDPMAWWGTLTQQFTEIAASAIKDGRAEAARETMGTMMKQSIDAAGETFKQAVAMPAAMAQQAAEVASTAAKASRKRPARPTSETPEVLDAAEPAAAAKPLRRTARKTSD